MSTKRKYKPKNHRLTQYIKVLGKQNNWNNYAVCLACSENLEENELSKLTFTNKKLQVKNHLKNCAFFREKIGSQKEVDAIINLTDNESEEIAKKKRLIADSDSGKIGREKVLRYLESMQSNLDTVFFKTIEGEISSAQSFVSTSTTLSKRHLHPVKTGDNVMGNILVRTPTKKEQPVFERLLLRVTVSNGFPLQWIKNTGRKVLSNRILNNETESIDKLQNEKLSNDQIGVTLAFDRWKNVLNQHIFGSLFITSSGKILIWNSSDISSERERMIEIIPKIEDLIKDAGVDLGAKVIAIISDSAAAYAGAR
ncbi:uncharacterized protein OCT59_018843 [Rhizophagus irregularis]|uniref:Uncharacterized protein n=1 Tax=Rhizophagus irregularis (strain DAOM 197198w) TaxID=1432141 RepID=A0A015MD70_RHIIW|nr:hypothetical protein RirG_139840 [Rhizophagus irregularis DAOM 197198w]UZO26629.1 hypothetical protein OCT59_018843 [Rhizophagus irregularis]